MSSSSRTAVFQTVYASSSFAEDTRFDVIYFMSVLLYNQDGLEFMKTQRFDHIISDPDYDHQTPIDTYRKYCTGNIVVFCDPRRRPISSMNPSECLAWHKSQSTKWPSKRFNTFFEEILVYKGDSLVFNKLHWTSMSGIFTDTFITKPDHPYTKPESLMEKLILAYTNPGETVFDPFSGSGTTAVACQRHGRNFIGCEINPEYFNLAQKRLGLSMIGN